MTKPQPRPFRIAYPDAQIADLQDRIARTRWPETPPGDPWAAGASTPYMQELAEYWRTGFDWRAWEAKLNAFPQFKVPLAGIDLHYIHAPSRKKDAMPLLLSHGWPGSVVEFHKILPLLTEHFTVIAPSLPGFALSYAPGQPRFSVEAMVEALHELMRDVLGYQRFGVQGGDWGGFVAAVMGARHPDSVTGIHVNFLAVRRDQQIADPTPEEAKFQSELGRFLKEETGYQWIQGTKPYTLGFGLHDSPVGLAAWLVEKFRTWTDCDGNPENSLTRDEMLADITLYWLSGAIQSSFWPYYARMHGPWPIPDGKTVDVPTGYIEFPKEIIRPPRSFASRMYTNIRRWTVAERGGHFAALEKPELLASETVAFFREIGAIG